MTTIVKMITVSGGALGGSVARVVVPDEANALLFAGWAQQAGYRVFAESMMEYQLPSRSPHELELVSILTRQYGRES